MIRFSYQTIKRYRLDEKQVHILNVTPFVLFTNTRVFFSFYLTKTSNEINLSFFLDLRLIWLNF